MSNPLPIDTLRLGGQELEKLIEQLERDSAADGSFKRTSRRWRAQAQRVIVTLAEQNGPERMFIMAPRNISSGGIGLLHGVYVRPGTTCRVALRRVHGNAVQLAGKVVRCEHVRGVIHQLGIRWDQPINPRDFFIWAGNEYLFNAEWVDPKRLEGMVLVVDDSIADQRLVEHHLRDTALVLEFAETGAEGLKKLEAGPGMALVDYKLGDMDGISLTTAARTRGLMTPIVLISGMYDQETRYAAIAAGAKEMLFKPITEQLLLRALAEYLLLADSSKGDADPFRITATHLAPAAIDACLGELQKHSESLGQLMQAQELERINDLLTRVHGIGEDFGIAALKQRCKFAFTKLDACKNVEAATYELKRVIEACDMAKGESASLAQENHKASAREAAH